MLVLVQTPVIACSPSGRLVAPDMCKQECLVNRHRGCGHNVLLYYTGQKYDCNYEYCGNSDAHVHKNMRSCSCPKTYADHIKVANLIQEACDACKEAAMAAHVGRRR